MTPLDCSFITSNTVHTQFLIRSEATYQFEKSIKNQQLIQFILKSPEMKYTHSAFITQNFKLIKHRLFIFRNNQS